MNMPIRQFIARPSNRKWPDLAAQHLATINLSTTLILFAIAAFFAATPRAGAATRSAELASLRVATPAEMRSGALLLKDGEQFVEAPQLGADVDVTVSGPTARARVSQIFRNPTQSWIEAIYVYPLPDGGAVDGSR